MLARYHKRVRLAAEGPPPLAGVPPRTPPTATKGLGPWMPLIDVIHPGEFAETHLNQRRVRAADCQLNLLIQRWVHCSLSLIVAAVPFAVIFG